MYGTSTVTNGTAENVTQSATTVTAEQGATMSPRQARAQARSDRRAQRQLDKKKAAAQAKIDLINKYSGYRGHRTILPFTNEDEESTPAKLQVVVRNLDAAEDGVPAESHLDVIPPHTNFFLTSAQESDLEKIHIVESFGGAVWAHMFGRKPRIWQFSGLLINSKNENWVGEWEYLYNRFLRGTKCAELGSQLKLAYEGKVIYGYMMGTSRSFNSVSPHAVPFNFSILISHVEMIRTESIIEAIEAGGTTLSVDGQGDIVAEEKTLAYTTEKAKEAVAGTDEAVGEQIESILSGS
jgi:hypothetical protein